MLASTHVLSKLKLDLGVALALARQSGASDDQLVSALDSFIEPMRPTRRPLK